MRRYLIRIAARAASLPLLVGLALGLATGCADKVSPKAAEVTEKIAMQTGEDPLVLVTFDDANAADPWRIINDDVMGGRSTSRMEVAPGGTAVFSGTISLENNGGFASTRSMAAPYNLAACQGMVLRVRGDGKTYKLTLKTDRDFDSAMYEADFVTRKDEWQEVRVPFASLVPTYHGRRLTDKPPLDASKVATIGLMVADKQEGPFRIEIDWIGAYKK